MYDLHKISHIKILYPTSLINLNNFIHMIISLCFNIWKFLNTSYCVASVKLIYVLKTITAFLDISTFKLYNFLLVILSFYLIFRYLDVYCKKNTFLNIKRWLTFILNQKKQTKQLGQPYIYLNLLITYK